MSVLNTGLATPATGFTIDQSLRFNLGDTAYLSKTFGTPTNRDIFTYSTWVKRGALGVLQYMFFGYTANNDQGFSALMFEADDTLKVGGYTADMIVSTQVFRDPSAWLHIVMAVDTTQSTASNRIKMYVNGETMPYSTSGSYPDQNEDTGFNGAHTHSISGRQPFSAAYFTDGYLAETHFIDGTQLTPSSFGETGDYGEWKPKRVAGVTYGTNGFYLSFAGGGVMTATGGTITTDGDYKVHSFTADGTFTPTSISNGGEVEYLVIAGGGGGGGVSNADSGGGGGGGAGGYRTGYLAVTEQAYSITVGDGGAGGVNGGGSAGSDGEDSVFSTITSDGGGRGAGYAAGQADAGDGGSGGGQDGHASSAAGGSATSGQGYDGGAGSNYAAAGGGGSSAVGVAGASQNGGAGGAGTASSITGSAVTKAGGGGGGAYTGSAGSAGSGGAGAGGAGGVAQHGVAGTANTGSGGGGGGGGGGEATRGNGGAGGSGIVIIRYKFQ